MKLTQQTIFKHFFHKKADKQQVSNNYRKNWIDIYEKLKKIVKMR